MALIRNRRSRSPRSALGTSEAGQDRFEPDSRSLDRKESSSSTLYPPPKHQSHGRRALTWVYERSEMASSSKIVSSGSSNLQETIYTVI